MVPHLIAPGVREMRRVRYQVKVRQYKKKKRTSTLCNSMICYPLVSPRCNQQPGPHFTSPHVLRLGGAITSITWRQSHLGPAQNVLDWGFSGACSRSETGMWLLQGVVIVVGRAHFNEHFNKTSRRLPSWRSWGVRSCLTCLNCHAITNSFGLRRKLSIPCGRTPPFHPTFAWFRVGNL